MCVCATHTRVLSGDKHTSVIWQKHLTVMNCSLLVDDLKTQKEESEHWATGAASPGALWLLRVKITVKASAFVNHDSLADLRLLKLRLLGRVHHPAVLTSCPGRRGLRNRDRQQRQPSPVSGAGVSGEPDTVSSLLRKNRVARAQDSELKAEMQI